MNSIKMDREKCSRLKWCDKRVDIEWHKRDHVRSRDQSTIRLSNPVLFMYETLTLGISQKKSDLFNEVICEHGMFTCERNMTEFK
jgi:hypothetical protein